MILSVADNNNGYNEFGSSVAYNPNYDYPGLLFL